MKLIQNILIVLSFLILISDLKAQDQILRSSVKLNNQVQMGESKAQVLQWLGQPSNEEEIYNEMEEKYLDKLEYGDSYLLFEDGKLVSFQILDSNLYLKANTTSIVFGSNISIYQSVYPNSYNKRFSYYAGPMLIVNLKTNISSEEVVLDEFLSIRFDSQTGLVNAIQYVVN